MTPPPPADTPTRRTNLGARGLLLAMVSLLALLAAIVVLVVLEQRQEEADLQVAKALEVRSTIHEVRGLLADAETGVRGFLLTGEEAFLEPYEAARVELDPVLDELTNLVADNEAQSGRVERVQQTTQDRLDRLDEQLEPSDEATQVQAMEFGRSLMDSIRADLAAMETTEDQLLAERRASSEQTRGILAAFIPTAGLIGLLGLIATVSFATGLTRRISRITANATRLGTGEPMAPVKRSNDDLGLLGDAILEAAGLLRRREGELHAAREFLEYLIEEGPVVMFRQRVDQSRELTYISPNAVRVLGIAPDSATGRHRFIASMLAPEHQEAFERGARAAVEGHVDGWYGEYETAAGARWLAIDIKVYRNGNEPPHLLGYAMDITDRMQATEAARVAELSYYALFEGIPTGILSTTSEGRIVDANRATARMLGFDSPDELMAAITDVRMIYADAGERLTLLGALRDKGAVTNYETRMKRRDGTVIDVAINARMVTSDNGESAGIEGTVIDITDRKQAELEMRRAQAEADRANQAKSVFLSRMSHELRTPLNSIIGFGQLLELSDPPLDATAQESVTHILKAGRHLLNLIDEVLDIARVEAGRLNISLEPIDIDEALTESIDLIRPMAAARSIEVEVPPEGCHTYVLADRQRIKQVFLNLLSNAIKYNQVGGTVRITCDTLGPDLAVSFADTGPGIAPAHLERLFTPFDRLDADDSDEGTGLGLVLSRHLLEAMASSLTVESELGRGSTFTVTVPRTEEFEIDETTHATGFFGTATAAQTWKVIYIEDNFANLRLIERILELRSDVDLEPAMQGRLGIELVRQHVPDLVLLDLNLPDMDGREVLLEIRSDPATAHIPVLVISADASPGQVQRLLDAGANGYLTKPVNVVEFLDRVDALLS